MLKKLNASPLTLIDSLTPTLSPLTVKPNRKAYRFLPPMKILTQTGSGAILRPIMTTKAPQMEVEEQIDCVTT